jgi:AAA+ ATPase superfamily predicted ATPase
VRRPDDLYDRAREWDDLAELVTARTPGLRIAIVSGRRRQGKSYLLRRVITAAGGLYHQAQEVGRAQALQRFGDDVAREHGLPIGTVRFDDWEAALRTALRLPARGDTSASQAVAGSRTLVLDELPYLLAHSPEIPSVLQELYDESRQSSAHPPAAVIVCGSALSVMTELLSGQKPLRGRATLDLTVQPFDYRDAARFWGASDPEVAFRLGAVFGGTPGYRSLVEQEPPATVDEIPRWLARNVLNPSHALFTETDYLLREDPRVRSKEQYISVLTAVAGGRHHQKEIGAAVGRDHNQLRHPLDVLVSSGFLTRDADILTPSRPRYAVTDPIVRFEALVTAPNRALLEEREVEAVWERAAATFSSQVLGPHFEEIARTWTRRYAGDRFGAPLGRVGSAVLNDAARRSRHEVDVVALRRDHDGPGRPPAAVLGEAKSSNRARTTTDLRRLERIRDLLAAQDARDGGARLVLFGRCGFDAELTAVAAERDDVGLVTLGELMG